MELTLTAAKPRLSALIAAAQRGERVVITKRGEPVVELVACPRPARIIEPEPEGDFFERLAVIRKRLGIEDMRAEDAKVVADALHDSALSRRVLGVDDK